MRIGQVNEIATNLS